MSSGQGRLLVVATPIGNLGDLTARAVETLRGAGVILAEDTRRTRSLLSHLGIGTPELVSLHEHNEGQKLGNLIERLKDGQEMVLVSDAGTPLVSDPGHLLVQSARENGIDVVPVPGVSAPLAALMACGLPAIPFTFIGFLPRKPGAVRKLFQHYRNVQTSLVFFERKNRVEPSLSIAFEELGTRDFCIARELTKTHEEFIYGTLSAEFGLKQELLGEITIVIAPPGEETPHSEEQVRDMIVEMMSTGKRVKEIAREVSSKAGGWSSKTVYDLAQNMKNRQDVDEL